MLIEFKNVNEFYSFHEFMKDIDALPLGQRFVEYCLKLSWPALFYETNDSKSRSLIEQWLLDNHYNDNFPTIHNFSINL
jgi:hypothetical protein